MIAKSITYCESAINDSKKGLTRKGRLKIMKNYLGKRFFVYKSNHLTVHLKKAR